MFAVVSEQRYDIEKVLVRAKSLIVWVEEIGDIRAGDLLVEVEEGIKAFILLLILARETAIRGSALEALSLAIRCRRYVFAVWAHVPSPECSAELFELMPSDIS